MTDLKPEDIELLRRARGGADPNDEDRKRVLRILKARLGLSDDEVGDKELARLLAEIDSVNKG